MLDEISRNFSESIYQCILYYKIYDQIVLTPEYVYHMQNK